MNTSSARTYLINGLALLGFLGLTIAAAYFNLGPFNTIVAMLISIAKAALIILFFMHVHRSEPLIWLLVGAGFFWLAIMLTLAMNDYMTRGWQ